MDWRHTLVLIFSLAPVTFGFEGFELPSPCFSEIYCDAETTHSLLHVVQMAKIYNDSKTFVDKSLKSSPEDVLQKFNQLMQVDFFTSDC